MEGFIDPQYLFKKSVYLIFGIAKMVLKITQVKKHGLKNKLCKCRKIIMFIYSQSAI